jgi:glycerol-3-phosphate cytidylyltransferase-like family protein
MINPARQIVVTGVFDDFLSIHLRFLEEAARFG